MDKEKMTKSHDNDATKTNKEADMDRETFEYLFDIAVDLTHVHFDDPTDDHVTGVFERLQINHKWGLGDAGATTVH